MYLMRMCVVRGVSVQLRGSDFVAFNKVGMLRWAFLQLQDLATQTDFSILNAADIALT